ncbi:LamB/YcsF family protein [Klebsiella pneumoniae subsp. pneumoniae]|nr:LamB/YcsF family protein [Klebsiella pneumoniae subsp. pneumoniae]
MVSSANIACGFHAGDAVLMQQCVREALKNGVAIGAHPSFPDRENFSRTAMQLPPETVYAQVLYQIGALAAIVHAQGASCGTSNRMACCTTRRRKSRLWPTLSPVRCAMPDADLVLVGLAGSELIRAGQHYQLTTRRKSSPIAAIRPTAAWLPRSQPGALIESEESRRWRKRWKWCSTTGCAAWSGEWAHVKAETVCLHGDGAHALDFARRLRAAFAGRNIDVSADLE